MITAKLTLSLQVQRQAEALAQDPPRPLNAVSLAPPHPLDLPLLVGHLFDKNQTDLGLSTTASLSAISVRLLPHHLALDRDHKTPDLC